MTESSLAPHNGSRPRDVILTRALTKRYEEFTAVDRLDLEVGAGEVFGFLGPNGAGKTTTIKMLMGLLVPTEGEARIAGHDCFVERLETKRSVGYLPDTPVFYDYLRGREILCFVAQMHGLDRDTLSRRVSELFERFRLQESEDEFAVNYSLGMKKKLALACALVHDPPVLILDEPTAGLDPRASRQIQELISHSAREGRTIFLSTHRLDIAEHLCDRVGIIDGGRLVAEGSPTQLRDRLAPGSSLEEVFFAVTDETRDDAEGAPE